MPNLLGMLGVPAELQLSGGTVTAAAELQADKPVSS